MVKFLSSVLLSVSQICSTKDPSMNTKLATKPPVNKIISQVPPSRNINLYLTKVPTYSVIVQP